MSQTPDPHICSRPKGHDGPCNGLPRAGCEFVIPGSGWGRVERLRGYTSAERKAMPVHTGVMRYFPDALAAIARHSKKANDKHNPGEPLHWARGKSMDHSDSAARHMLTPDAIDPDTGEMERVGAAWRILADLQMAEERRLVAAGILPLSGIVPEETK